MITPVSGALADEQALVEPRIELSFVSNMNSALSGSPGFLYTSAPLLAAILRLGESYALVGVSYDLQSTLCGTNDYCSVNPYGFLRSEKRQVFNAYSQKIRRL